MSRSWPTTPTLRVGEVLAVYPPANLAAVGDIPVADFHTGDPITFVVGQNAYVTGHVLQVVNGNLHVRYEVADASARPPQVGDVAVHFSRAADGAQKRRIDNAGPSFRDAGDGAAARDADTRAGPNARAGTPRADSCSDAGPNTKPAPPGPTPAPTPGANSRAGTARADSCSDAGANARAGTSRADARSDASTSPSRATAGPFVSSFIERAPNAYVSTIKDRTLFRNATFVLEVSARRPLTEIQLNLPAFLKVGPNTKMNEIVHAHLPGVQLVHLPTPPPQIRAITDHVYFYLDRTSPLWPEFSQATAIGMHFAGDWPELQMELWAVREDRR